jgi:hypothetical protein
MLAAHNHVMNINMKHQINVNAIEESIHVPIIPGAAEIRPKARALMAIQVLIENERRDIELNARNSGLTVFQARDKLKPYLLLAGSGVVPETLSIDQTAMES